MPRPLGTPYLPLTFCYSFGELVGICRALIVDLMTLLMGIVIVVCYCWYLLLLR